MLQANDPTTAAGISSNDFRLIEEALERLSRQEPGVQDKRDSLFETMADQVRRGRRDMFTLVRTGRRALEGR